MLSEARAFIAAVTVGNKVFFAGGTRGDNTSSDCVDIYDASTGLWDTASLSVSRAFSPFFATSICNKAYFVGGAKNNFYNMQWEDPTNVIDIYNEELDEWSVDYMPQTVINHTVGGAVDHLLVGGGIIYPLPGMVVSDVEIFIDEDCPIVGIEVPPDHKGSINIYPNPVTSSATIEFELDQPGNVIISIFDRFGKEADQMNCQGHKGKNQLTWDAGSLPSGIYICRVTSGNESVTRKLVLAK